MTEIQKGDKVLYTHPITKKKTKFIYLGHIIINEIMYCYFRSIEDGGKHVFYKKQLEGNIEKL